MTTTEAQQINNGAANGLALVRAARDGDSLDEVIGTLSAAELIDAAAWLLAVVLAFGDDGDGGEFDAWLDDVALEVATGEYGESCLRLGEGT